MPKKTNAFNNGAWFWIFRVLLAVTAVTSSLAGVTALDGGVTLLAVGRFAVAAGSLALYALWVRTHDYEPTAADPLTRHNDYVFSLVLLLVASAAGIIAFALESLLR